MVNTILQKTMFIPKLFIVLLLVLAVLPMAYAFDISFFEEFPSKKNFAKLEHVSHPTKLYIATNSTEEFLKWKKHVEKNHKGKVTEFVYWPILKEKEGYWVSPWTKRKALKELFSSLEEQKEPISVMLDIEFPLRRSLLLTESHNFVRNRKLIRNFINNSVKKNITIYTIQMSHLSEGILKPLGMSYDMEKYPITPIHMYYSSFRRVLAPDVFVDANFKVVAEKAAEEKSILAIGLIATGIHGDEPYYTMKELQEDMDIAEEAGVSEVVVFRLGGVTKKYNSVVSR